METVFTSQAEQEASVCRLFCFSRKEQSLNTNALWFELNNRHCHVSDIKKKRNYQLLSIFL